MSRFGAAGDNAAMESFFSLLQKNGPRPPLLDHARGIADRAIIMWIERAYHRRRRLAAFGRFTPVEFELIMTPPATQAA